MFSLFKAKIEGNRISHTGIVLVDEGEYINYQLDQLGFRKGRIPKSSIKGVDVLASSRGGARLVVQGHGAVLIDQNMVHKVALQMQEWLLRVIGDIGR